MGDKLPSEIWELEQSLRRHAPASLPEALQRQLQAAASERATLGDRIFAMWAAMGAVAACAVAAMTVWQFVANPVAQGQPARETAYQQQMIEQYRQILAMR